MKAGQKFRAVLAEESPLQIVGAINAYAGMMATRAGFKSLYVSGAGVANMSYGVPDLGITSLDNVLIDVQRLTDACDLPILVDIDTGWGSAFNIARTIKQMIKAGAAAVHIEDQVANKRCGHRPNKAIISTQEMVDRIKIAVDARTDESFVIMARTDALANEGMDASLERVRQYIDAGADMVFPEALTELEQYKQFANELNVPILANLTEFGATPYFSLEALSEAGVAMALYPLSASRAMMKAAECVYQTIRKTGTQKDVLEIMQTRAELYDYLDYTAFENKLDALFAKELQDE